MRDRWHLRLLVAASGFVASMAMAQTTKEVSIAWDPNTEADLDFYQIYRDFAPCDRATLSPLLRVAKNVTNYVDRDIPADKTVACYGLTALDTSTNESQMSNLLQMTPTAARLDPPTDIAFDNKRFTWTPNPAAAQTRLYVHISGQPYECPGSGYVLCGPVPGTEVLVSAMAWDTPHDCWMTSVDAAGVEGPAGGVSCSTGPPPAEPPVIAVSASIVTMTGMVNSPAPTSQTITITNAGGGSLAWTASSSAAWLSVTPASGTAPSSLALAVAGWPLAAGSYTATVTVAAPGLASRTIGVTLTVAPDTQAPAPPQNLRPVSRPTAGSVILGWTQPGATPEATRIDRWDGKKWIAAKTVTGTTTEAQVSIPTTGRHQYRACAIVHTQPLCNNKDGVWAAR